MRTSLWRASLVGAAAATVVVALMFALRLGLQVQSLPDIAADAMTLVVPGSVFGFLIDRLQHLGRPLLLVGFSGTLVVLGAVVAAIASRVAASALVRGAIALGAMLVVAVPIVVLGTITEQRPALLLSTIAYWALYAAMVSLASGAPAAARLAPAVAVPRRFLLYAAGVIAAAYLARERGGRVVAALAPAPAETTVLPTPTFAATSASPGLSASATADPFASLGGLTATKDFYVISKNGVDDPAIDASRWSLTVTGEHRFTIGYDELRALQSVHYPQTLECISNVPGGPLISTAMFQGVRLRTLLERAGVPADTVEIRFSCADGYTESLPLDTATDDETIVAWAMNGAPLAREHGFPARVLVPGRYGMKNPKWLTQIAPVSQPYDGYWPRRGWNKDAFVRTWSRLDYPQERDRVPVGRPFPMRGVAFAGSRGIGVVEISFDGGRTWVETQLRRVLDKNDWTIFTYEWRPQKPGTYATVVRATDADGTLQDPADHDSFPDGPSGYHRVALTAQ